MPTSGASAANRESTDAFKLVLGTDSGAVAATTTKGIIGSMFKAAYVPFTGMLQTHVYDREKLPQALNMPECTIIAYGEKGYSEEVGGSPHKISTMMVVATFRTQTESEYVTHYDIEFYRQKYTDMIIHATQPTHAVVNFLITPTDAFAIYKIMPEWELPPPALEPTGNGNRFVGQVKHRVMVRRS